MDWKKVKNTTSLGEQKLYYQGDSLQDKLSIAGGGFIASGGLFYYRVILNHGFQIGRGRKGIPIPDFIVWIAMVLFFLMGIFGVYMLFKKKKYLILHEYGLSLSGETFFYHQIQSAKLEGELFKFTTDSGSYEYNLIGELEELNKKAAFQEFIAFLNDEEIGLIGGL